MHTPSAVCCVVDVLQRGNCCCACVGGGGGVSRVGWGGVGVGGVL
jgi:hypothetical protein